MKKMEEYVRSIPDFPEKGIIFRDVTSVLQDADGLALAIDSMKKMLEGIHCGNRVEGLYLWGAYRLFPTQGICAGPEKGEASTGHDFQGI